MFKESHYLSEQGFFKVTKNNLNSSRYFFIFNHLFICLTTLQLFFLLPLFPLLHIPSPLCTTLPIQGPSVSIQWMEGLPRKSTNLGSLIECFVIYTSQDKGPQNWKDSVLLPLKWDLQEDQAHKHNIYPKGIGKSHADFLVVGSVFVSSYESQLVDSVGFLAVSA